MDDMSVCAKRMLDLTLAMLAAAEKGDFSLLTELERQRSDLFSTFSREGASPLALKDTWLELQRLDQRIVSLVEQERDMAEAELKRLRSVRKAAKAYTAL